MARPLAVLTGGSSGIGAALAPLLVLAFFARHSPRAAARWFGAVAFRRAAGRPE